jgi:hypothetical protein
VAILQILPAGRTAGLAFFVGAPERSDTEVEKDRYYSGCDKEGAVVGALENAGPHAPQVRSKDNHGQEKEDAGNFKPDDSADTAERAQKAAYAFGDSAAGLAGDTAGGAGLVGINGDGTAGRGAGGGMRTGRHVLTGNAARNAKSNAENATDGLRFHFEYDGSSDDREAHFCRVLCATQLL